MNRKIIAIGRIGGDTLTTTVSLSDFMDRRWAGLPVCLGCGEKVAPASASPLNASRHSECMGVAA